MFSLAADDSVRFGFTSGRWFEELRRAETHQPLGRLGPFELLEEAGRGGQGVVFRARQPGTGREIAVKRLLAGPFASPRALRRFEREVEAAAALSHPGIVTVYGVDLVDGSPVLSMEWVDGVPLTRWAAGRPRAEVLALFLRVCDAVQHAHQRGVLHRDLKPSNVLVDDSGRPRVLDFGLAKLASDSEASITSSGDFVGTPAYAAPEQWNGEELDVRADVYSLGALLFEMLTGRRVVEGEGLKLMANATSRSTPRPSSIVRSIPRELDAIALQALAREREQRYQSLDVFAADVRRFLAGEPISAHPPRAWYMLRKLVARNRLASALVVLLLGATLVYAALAVRHADQLAGERDRALLAGEARARALVQAESERERAELALTQVEEQRRRVELERENVEQVLAFFATDIMREADPKRHGHEPSLAEILRSCVGKAPERFPEAPLVAARVHRMLGNALLELGCYPEAESELRAALELDVHAESQQIARDETQLGLALYNAGNHEQAEGVLRSAVRRFEATTPLDASGLGTALDALAMSLGLTSRSEEALPLLARAIELTHGGERAAARANLGAILRDMGRYDDARAQFEQALPELIESEGERSADVATVLANLAGLDAAAGNVHEAVKGLRRSLEVKTQIFGPEHPETARSMARLAEILVHAGALDEAEDHARRALAVLGPAGVEGPFLQMILGNVALERGDLAGAEPHLAEAARAFDELGHRANFQVAAESLLDTLEQNGKLAEAEALLLRVLEVAQGRDRAWALGRSGRLRSSRGDHEDAIQYFEDAVALLVTLPNEKALLSGVLRGYADVLRRSGDVAGADELEREAAGE